MKPVLDLEAHDPVDSDRVPDRHAELTAVRDRTCVFPWCTRPARRCDTDHTIPRSPGRTDLPVQPRTAVPATPPDQDPRHWTYTTIEPGTYLWTSQHGYQYLRDPHGTQDVTRDRHRPPD